MDNKFTNYHGSILDSNDNIKNVQIGVVKSITDPLGLGRIKIRIPGKSNVGGDDEVDDINLPWAHSLVPKYFTSTPKVGEAVFVLFLTQKRSHSDRLYFGPIISQLDKLNFERYSTTALNIFDFSSTKPDASIDTIPELNGIFHKKDDIAIQGRYNTDIILRKNEILIRSGKFTEITGAKSPNNPYSFKFNKETPGFIQIKNDVQIRPVGGANFGKGSVTNIVSNKINLMTHEDGTPSITVNQDSQLSEDEMLNFIKNAHPLPYGDILVQYLKLLKKAFLNHVHNYNGIPPTDLNLGAGKPVKEFRQKSDDLEKNMLSKNININ